MVYLSNERFMSLRRLSKGCLYCRIALADVMHEGLALSPEDCAKLAIKGPIYDAAMYSVDLDLADRRKGT